MTAADKPSLLELTAGRLLDDAAEAGGPASGAIAALTTGLAASMVTMAARAAAPSWDEAGGVAAQADALRRRAAILVDANAATYERARSLLADAAQLDERSRDWQLGRALAAAAAVPMAITEISADVATLAAHVASNYTGHGRADAVGAAALAAGAARASAHLVAVNLGVPPGDAQGMRAAELEAIAEQAAKTARLEAP